MSVSPPDDDKELVECFESLGNNCEFGAVQRFCGAEPLGLFRFAYSELPALVQGLNKDFDDIGQPGNVTAEFTNFEWFVQETNYGFRLHTFNPDEALLQERVIALQEKWFRYMSRRLIESIELADRIYVRKCQPEVSEAEIRTLSAAIRRHGKATLLWISEANEDHPAETVERLDEGLLHGWISHFTPMDVVMTTDPMKWMPVLRRAWTMTHGGDPSNIRPHARPNLLPRAFGHWVGHDAATCDHIWHLPPCPLGGMAITHRLISQRPDGSPAYGCLVTDDLIPGEMYVASAYVWIPDDFAPTIVSMELHGTMSVYFKIADLSRRNCWQLTWVCGRMATDSTVMFPRIRVGGQLGAIMHSAGWRFEKGAVPRNMPLIG